MNSSALNLQTRGDGAPDPAPLSPATVNSLAMSVHGSLVLADILRACHRVLRQHFPLGRLSLVQRRSNESMATVYSLDKSDNSLMIGPTVILLEPSRLKGCMADRAPCVVQLRDAADQDAIEQHHLLHPDDRAVIYSPLVFGQKFKGVLILALHDGSKLTAMHTSLLAHTTAHLAQAIENSDNHYLERRRGRQLSMVSEIARQVVLVEDLGDFLRAASELIRVSLEYSEVQIWTAGHAPEGFTLAARAGKSNAPQEQSPPKMVGQCARQDKTLCDNTPSVLSDMGSGSRLAVPIRLRSKWLGVLFLQSDRLDAFPFEDLNTIEGIASLIASAFDNLRAFAYARESNEYMQAILESAKNVAILFTDTLGYVITSSIGSANVFQLSQNQIVGKDILTLFTDPRFRKELAAYISGKEISTLESTRLSQEGNDTTSYLDVSLQRVYDSDQRALGFLCIAQNVTENVRLERRLESLSITDELTRLYNRRQFFSTITGEIKRCHRFHRSISLCFLDLDRFKQYNDTHGHLKGDQALKETAALVLSLVRAGVDTCYRYGGDEFTVIMPETTAANARVVAERIRERLSLHFQHEITASVGITSSVDSLQAENLIARADQAMYNAKSLGGNRTVLAE
jgi:diguanylate cyclase (GGDEF)-like protein/PAS domain S-box-containing protein